MLHWSVPAPQMETIPKSHGCVIPQAQMRYQTPVSRVSKYFFLNKVTSQFKTRYTYSVDAVRFIVFINTAYKHADFESIQRNFEINCSAVMWTDTNAIRV